MKTIDPNIASVKRATEAPDWPEPAPLPEGLPAVPPMTPDMLPGPFRDWLVDTAERMQCPLDYLGIGAVGAFSSVVGRRCAIRPKQRDCWTVVPNLWGAIVGSPGSLKSPALKEAAQPCLTLADEARAEHATAQRDYLKKRRDIEREIRAAESADDDDTAASLRECLGELERNAPVLRRYTVNDSTVERLGMLMQENPQGLLQIRDELTGWLHSLDKQGHEMDRAFYLEAWAGNGSFTVDRVARGTLHIEALCLSLLGGIQPGPLAELVKAAQRPGANADGLMQRLQLLVYPDPVRIWRPVDRAPNLAAKERAMQVFRRVDRLDACALGLETDDANPLPFLRIAAEAQPLVDQFLAGLHSKALASAAHPAYAAHLSKYASLMLSLALLFHLAERIEQGPPGPVSVSAVSLALRWCEYLDAHARRIYRLSSEGDIEPARTLAERIRRRELAQPFSARDVYQHGWGGLAGKQAAVSALDVLQDLNWVHVERQDTGGRPRMVYHVNPKVYR